MDTREVWRPGDLVFAKMRSYPAWPARVEFQTGPVKYDRYKVYFFGTQQMGICNGSSLSSYLSHKETLGKPKKLTGFKEGMEEIKKEWEMNKLHQTKATTSGHSSRGSRSAQDRNPKADKKDVSRKRKAEDIKTWEHVLKPCYVRLNRVSVPASGWVCVNKTQATSVNIVTPDDGANIVTPDHSANLAAPDPSGNLVEPASSQDVTQTSGAKVREKIKPRLKRPRVKSLDPNRSTLTVKTSPAPSTSAPQLKANSKSVRVMPGPQPSTNQVFPSQGLTNTSVDTGTIQLRTPLSKPVFQIQIASKLVPDRRHIPSRSQPKPHIVSGSESPHTTPISVSELASVKPTSSTNVVFETDDDYEARHKCIFCGSKFYCFDKLHTHTSNFHGKYTFCRKCKTYFKSSKLLQLHEAMCLSSRARYIFHCNSCSKSFVSKEFLIEHLRNRHAFKSTGSLNGNNFLTVLATIKDELKSKTKNHVISPCVIDCHTCKLTYTIDKYIATHLEQSYSLTRCQCSFCGIDPSIFYLEPIKYLLHIQKHILNDFMVTQCEVCGMKLISKYSGFTHMLHAHSTSAEKEEVSTDTTAKVITEDVSEPQDVVQTDKVTTTDKRLIEARNMSNFSDSSITSEVETAEYVLEVYEGDTEEKTDNAQHMDDSCNLLEWMDISEQETDKPKTQFLVHCTVCSADVPDTSFFEEHIKDCVKDDMFACPLCGLDILISDDAHFKYHLQHQDLIKCRKCNTLFFNDYNQALHLGNKHYSILRD